MNPLEQLVENAEAEMIEKKMDYALRVAQLAATLLSGEMYPNPEQIESACKAAAKIFGVSLQIVTQLGNEETA
jgi:hypothetical protein